MVSKKKAGRPRVKIDWGQFEKLCGLQCTKGEIASWFECSFDTIKRAVKREFGITFAEKYAEKAGKGKIALRRAQFQAAVEKHNATMLIWLGKQWLGQSDSPKAQEETSSAIIDLRLVD